MKIQNSPVTQHQFNGVDFYLKRDDKLHPQFSGNKARKFMGLLDGDFPAIMIIFPLFYKKIQKGTTARPWH
jgi:1-aminocyclopropane-1-carboxylate deaminase/D-cysteine desulfhydrase-like pyridoxal-dependent ACC family enzyme